jgi:hypothetical protein
MKICWVSRAAMAFVLFSASVYAATVTVRIQDGSGGAFTRANVSITNALMISGSTLEDGSAWPTTAATINFGLVETLSGATNSPHTTNLSVSSTTQGGVEPIGDTNIEPQRGTNSNFIVVNGPFTLSTPDTLRTLSMYTYAAPGVGKALALGLYDATGPNGTAGNLVGRTAFFTPGAGPTWNTQPVISQAPLPAGKYYPSFIELNNSIQVAGSATGKACWAGVWDDFQYPFPTTANGTGNVGCESATFSLCANCDSVVKNPPPLPRTDCVAKTTQAGSQQMAIMSPCSTNAVLANQATAPALIEIEISDASMLVSGQVPISVQALGMQNVEVWTHGALATRLTAGANGMFSGTLDLSHKPTGPIHVRFEAFDVPPGGTPTVVLIGEETLFVNAGAKTKSPFPKGAAGMTLAWSDQFATLSATPCKPGTGIWPNCTAPTAADGFTYNENKGDGTDFGDCAFEHTDSPKYNPYTVLNGFLRIRSTYDPGYVDPYGHNRKWYCGLLTTSFSDHSSNVPPLSTGYFEATILVPNAAAAAGATGGTWPGGWMGGRNATAATGGIEVDMMEEYGNDPSYMQSGVIGYAPATGGGWIFHGDPVAGLDLTWDFHRYGILVTSTTLTSYLDDMVIGSAPIAQYADESTPIWGFLLDLAMGSGWPVNAPPANLYDMWIKEIRLYH